MSAQNRFLEASGNFHTNAPFSSLRGPERARFPHLCEGGHETASILQTTGKIIRIQAPGKKIARKKLSQSRQVNDPFFRTRSG
jgi:hypothetical protein